MLELRKLKLRKETVTVEWCTREGEDGKRVHVHTLEGGEPPHPDLMSAMRQLLAPCLDLLELPARYADTCRVTTVIVSQQKGGVRGLQVNLVKTLAGSGRPLNLTTPLLVESEDGDETHEALWDLLGTVIREAEAYTTGKRAQGELFDGAETLEPAEVGA